MYGERDAPLFRAVKRNFVVQLHETAKGEMT